MFTLISDISLYNKEAILSRSERSNMEVKEHLFHTKNDGVIENVSYKYN